MIKPNSVKIKNVVFDVGNVLVKWAPYEVIKGLFPERNPEEFYQQMRLIWIDLNLGRMTEEEAIVLYQNQLAISKDQISRLMNEFKTHQTPIPGSLVLLKKLEILGMNLFSITDNIKEIMEYHRKNSEFIGYFKDIVVSADIGVLKPDARIYQHLLNKHHLSPSETVFIDDLKKNVEGALAVGMSAIQFTDVQSCEVQLIELGVAIEYGAQKRRMEPF
jgi:putative hydrolase of the HAD superfamily